MLALLPLWFATISAANDPDAFPVPDPPAIEAESPDAAPEAPPSDPGPPAANTCACATETVTVGQLLEAAGRLAWSQTVTGAARAKATAREEWTRAEVRFLAEKQELLERIEAREAVNAPPRAEAAAEVAPE